MPAAGLQTCSCPAQTSRLLQPWLHAAQHAARPAWSRAKQSVHVLLEVHQDGMYSFQSSTRLQRPDHVMLRTPKHNTNELADTPTGVYGGKRVDTVCGGKQGEDGQSHRRQLPRRRSGASALPTWHHLQPEQVFICWYLKWIGRPGCCTSLRLRVLVDPAHRSSMADRHAKRRRG